MQAMPGSWRTRLLMVALLVTIGPTWSQEQAPDPATSRRVARVELARSIRAFATATLAHGECQVARGRLSASLVDDDLECAICMVREKTVVLGCGHRTCEVCARQLERCHVCRVPVTQRIRVYD